MNSELQLVSPVEWCGHLATLCQETFPPEARIHGHVAALISNAVRLERLGLLCNVEDMPAVPATTADGARIHPEVWRMLRVFSGVADAAFPGADVYLDKTLRYTCTNLKNIRAELRGFETERAA